MLFGDLVTSVPSERLFSKAGLAISDRLSRLTACRTTVIQLAWLTGLYTRCRPCQQLNLYMVRQKCVSLGKIPYLWNFTKFFSPNLQRLQKTNHSTYAVTVSFVKITIVVQ